MIQTETAGLVSSSRAMLGSATLTMELSSTDMLTPRIRVSTAQ